MGRIEVELPDAVDVSKYSHGELREPTAGEHYINNHARIDHLGPKQWVSDRIVLIPKWEYPEWLGGAGIAMENSGGWMLCERQPSLSPISGCYWTDYGSWVRLRRDRFPLFTPPPCTDWRKSWTPNPRWEATNGTH